MSKDEKPPKTSNKDDKFNLVYTTEKPLDYIDADEEVRDFLHTELKSQKKLIVSSKGSHPSRILRFASRKERSKRARIMGKETIKHFNTKTFQVYKGLINKSITKDDLAKELGVSKDSVSFHLYTLQYMFPDTISHKRTKEGVFWTALLPENTTSPEQAYADVIKRNPNVIKDARGLKRGKGGEVQREVQREVQKPIQVVQKLPEIASIDIPPSLKLLAEIVDKLANLGTIKLDIDIQVGFRLK